MPDMNDKLKILIVEDEGIISAGMAACVEALGHETAGQAYTGMEAVQLAAQEDVDIVLMDINLPDMSGIDALKEISRTKEIPCVFVTGYSDQHLIVEANEISQTYGYLIKPVDQAELDAAIKIAIMRAQEKKSLKQAVYQAEKKLSDRKLIERAKGILMDSFSMKENDAMKYMQKQSNEKNKKLAVVAEDIISLLGK